MGDAIPERPPVHLFYDGECGLCHGAVRWLLARRGAMAEVRFAPLQGETAARLIGDERLSRMPDSLLLREPGGQVLDRSRAALRLLSLSGGGWAAAARVLGLIPRPIRDGAYDLVARLRHRLFARPIGLCPRIPPELAERFDP